MYQVSDAYKAAMKAEAQKFKITGTINAVAFTDENILAGSLTITNQCCDTSAMTLGAVYIGELKATFRQVSISRSSWQSAVITPYFSIYTSNGWESIPLGVFTVSEANHTASGVQVTAYDNMNVLDSAAAFNSSYGTAYQILTTMCTETGLTLGMTKAEVEALPNGSITLGIYADNDISTWRDMLSYLAAAMGCFATMDRAGALVLRKFGNTVVDTIDDEHRFTGARFSDFATYYSGIYVWDRQTDIVRYYGSGADGLTFTLGGNPFLQYGLDETIESMCNAICTAIGNINYVPYKVTAIGNPAYDLGDVLCFSDGIADGSKLYCLMKYVFKYNGAYEMQGVGENPALATGNSKVDKNIIGLIERNLSETTISFYSYHNSEDITVANGDTETLVYIRFGTASSTHMVFQAEICLTAETEDFYDAVGRVTYYVNGVESLAAYPTETWQDGAHILHLFYDIAVTEDLAVNTFSATLTMNGGNATIPVGNVRGVLFGQGVANNSNEANSINLEDTLPVITGTTFNPFKTFTDSVSVGVV